MQHGMPQSLIILVASSNLETHNFRTIEGAVVLMFVFLIVYMKIIIGKSYWEIFELCLSRIMDVYLFTSDNQFGFKQKHSTDLCIYIQ